MTPLRALREAVVSMAPVLATLAVVLLVAPQPSLAALGVVLCLSLTRVGVERSWRALVPTGLALPVVGLVTVGVGILLKELPVVGAVIFTAVLFVSVWLRRFGPVASRAGSLLALPLITLLIAPGAGSGSWLLQILVSLVAFAAVVLFRFIGEKTRLITPSAKQARAVVESTLRPTPSTRMAIQLAVAVGAAFAIGYLFFPERWAWVVLTAYIVSAGNRGRADVAHKSVIRVLGAIAGTLVALLIGTHISADAATVTLILAAVFLGIWLRPIGYAFWPLFVTIALALLQSFGPSQPLLLWPRVEEIVIGAILGVLAAWFVLPIWSSDVVRRRLGIALAVLDWGEGLDAAAEQVIQLRPPFALWRRMSARLDRRPQPADWIDTFAACVALAAAVLQARPELTAARRALRDPRALGPALDALRVALTPPE